MTKGRLAALAALTVAADVMTKVIAVRTLADDAIDQGIIGPTADLQRRNCVRRG